MIAYSPPQRIKKTPATAGTGLNVHIGIKIACPTKPLNHVLKKMSDMAACGAGSLGVPSSCGCLGEHLDCPDSAANSKAKGEYRFPWCWRPELRVERPELRAMSSTNLQVSARANTCPTWRRNCLAGQNLSAPASGRAVSHSSFLLRARGPVDATMAMRGLGALLMLLAIHSVASHISAVCTATSPNDPGKITFFTGTYHGYSSSAEGTLEIYNPSDVLTSAPLTKSA